MCWTPILCHFYDVICSPGYVDLLTQFVILWSHWKTSGNVYVGLATRSLPLLNKETVQVMVWTARGIGVIKSPQVVICEKKYTLTSNNQLWGCLNSPCLVLFSAVDLVAKHSSVKTTMTAGSRLPKAFVSSAGILNLPITSLPDYDFNDPALWC